MIIYFVENVRVRIIVLYVLKVRFSLAISSRNKELLYIEH